MVERNAAISSVLVGAAVALIAGGGPAAVAGGVASASTIYLSRKYPGIADAILESVPSEIRLVLPTVSIVYQQLQKDLASSSFSSPVLQELIEGRTLDDLAVIAPGENFIPAVPSLIELFPEQRWGTASSEDVSTFREIDASESITIDCQSISVGAFATLTSLKRRHGLNFVVDPSGASGREQALTKNYLDDDLLISADAPMALQQGGFTFQKLLTVTVQQQSLLSRTPSNVGHLPSVFVYPQSSVEHHLKLMRESNSGHEFRFPTRVSERPIYDLSDYTNLGRIMEPGDYVFAWEPILSTLLASKQFQHIPGTDFSLPISMFKRSDSVLAGKYLESFLRLFVVEWNLVQRNPLFAWFEMCKVSQFRESIIRGATLDFNHQTN